MRTCYAGLLEVCFGKLGSLWCKEFRLRLSYGTEKLRKLWGDFSESFCCEKSLDEIEETFGLMINSLRMSKRLWIDFFGFRWASWVMWWASICWEEFSSDNEWKIWVTETELSVQAVIDYRNDSFTTWRLNFHIQSLYGLHWGLN